MKPIDHAMLHAKKYGGQWQDYIEIDDFLDDSKSAHPSMKHRAIFHHSYGTYLVERIFGHQLINSDQKAFSPRQVAEDHIIQDLGFLPSVDTWLKEMNSQGWMGNPTITVKTVNLVD